MVCANVLPRLCISDPVASSERTESYNPYIDMYNQGIYPSSFKPQSSI